MEKLLGHRKARRGNGNEFLVRWAGKDAATDPPTPWSDSYEPESGVADDLIEGYLYFARVTGGRRRVQMGERRRQAALPPGPARAGQRSLP